MTCRDAPFPLFVDDVFALLDPISHTHTHTQRHTDRQTDRQHSCTDRPTNSTQLPCPALPCPALPCPALPCPALSPLLFSSFRAGSDGSVQLGCFVANYLNNNNLQMNPEYSVDNTRFYVRHFGSGQVRLRATWLGRGRGRGRGRLSRRKEGRKEGRGFGL